MAPPVKDRGRGDHDDTQLSYSYSMLASPVPYRTDPALPVPESYTPSVRRYLQPDEHIQVDDPEITSTLVRIGADEGPLRARLRRIFDFTASSASPSGRPPMRSLPCASARPAATARVACSWPWCARPAFPRADDKALCKERLVAHGIPVPETIALRRGLFEVDAAVETLRERDHFVIKPANGSGGEAILVVGHRDGDGWATAKGASLGGWSGMPSSPGGHRRGAARRRP